MRFSAIYAILVGVLMMGQWSLSLARGRVPELETAPVRIAAHLVAEFLTAVALIVGGAGMLGHVAWGSPLTLVALGMLIYTLIASPGYFGQRGEWPMVILFGVLLVLALISALSVLRSVLRGP